MALLRCVQFSDFEFCKNLKSRGITNEEKGNKKEAAESGFYPSEILKKYIFI